MKPLVLIIEDHRVNRELMCYLLQMSNYEVLEAENGEAGIRLALEKQPSLIICDIRMPDLSGFEVLKKLKANKGTDSIPVVAVTAQSMQGDREEILAWGFDGYISKPIDPVRFVDEIENFLPNLYANRKTHRINPKAPSTQKPDSEEAKAVILIVDNLQMNLDLAKSLLEGNSYKVVSALSMFEALTLLETGLLPDLIISDVIMQDGSGFDFIKNVKSSRKLQRIPFMFLTSTARSRDNEKKASELGAVRYVLRPIDSADLLYLVETVLREYPAGKKGD